MLYQNLRLRDEVKQAQAAWARYLGRQVEEEDEIAPGVKMAFVLVPLGRLWMGSPAGEAVQIQQALENKGIASRLILIPGEGHGSSKRGNQVIEIGNVLKFFEMHLKGGKSG